MEVKIDLKKKEFEKARVIKEIARHLAMNGASSLSWDNPLREVLMNKAHKMLETEPEFEDKIFKEIKVEMKSKKLIKQIAKDLIQEKLERENY